MKTLKSKVVNNITSLVSKQQHKIPNKIVKVHSYRLAA